MDSDQLFQQTLKKNGFSLTTTRQLVFKAFEHQEPLAMAQLFTRLEGQLDRATLYRTVDLFEKLGIIQRLQVGWKHVFELTDGYSFHHHHLSCTSCGAILPIREDRTLEAAVRSIAVEYGFTEVTHQFEIRGRCPSCQAAA